MYVKEKEEAQDALTAYDEPAYMSAEMASKLSKYEADMEKALAKKPKPKKPKVPVALLFCHRCRPGLSYLSVRPFGF